MSNDVPKQNAKAASPDAAIKTSANGEIALTEEELDRASGGLHFCAAGQHIKKAVLTVRKAGGEQPE